MHKLIAGPKTGEHVIITEDFEGYRRFYRACHACGSMDELCKSAAESNCIPFCDSCDDDRQSPREPWWDGDRWRI